MCTASEKMESLTKDGNLRKLRNPFILVLLDRKLSFLRESLSDSLIEEQKDDVQCLKSTDRNFHIICVCSTRLGGLIET